MKRWSVGLLLIGLLLALSPGVSLAQGDGRPRLVLTDHYVLAAGDTVEGGLVVVAQTVVLQPGSVVNGDAALIGNLVTVEGVVQGELTALGEEVILGDGLQVGGSAYLCADAIRRQPDAHINGAYQPGCEQIGSLLTSVVPVAFDSSRWQWERGEFSLADWQARIDFTPDSVLPTFGERLGIMAALMVVAGATAGFFTLLAPLRLRRISEAALSAPLATAGVGFLSLVVASGITGLVIISLVLLVTFCLVPLVGLGWMVLAVMLAMGWAAVCLPFGAWFLARIGVRPVRPVMAGVTGAVLVIMFVSLLMLVNLTLPLFLLLMLLLESWGLGAVILTRGGGLIYPNPRSTAMPRARAGQSDWEDLPYNV